MKSNQILLMVLFDFGAQAMAYKLLGYQWDSHGAPDPKTKYTIKVVVFKDIRLKEIRQIYPISGDMKQDYRYIEYKTALIYLKKQIIEIEELQIIDLDNNDLFIDLKTTLQQTKMKILDKLGG